MEEIKLTLEKIPPPKQVHVQRLAESMGLCDGLRVETSDGVYRCYRCGKLQPAGSCKVWVPDEILPGESTEMVTEMCRLNTFNGRCAAWCVKCAPKKATSLDGDAMFAACFWTLVAVGVAAYFSFWGGL